MVHWKYLGEAFNTALSGMMRLEENGIIKPINTLFITNMLWAIAHGVSTLLTDGQIQQRSVFLNAPALLLDSKDAFQIDVEQIFDCLNDIDRGENVG